MHYVVIIGITEETFWHEQISTLKTIAANKVAYDNWKTYIVQKEAGRR